MGISGGHFRAVAGATLVAMWMAIWPSFATATLEFHEVPSPVINRHDEATFPFPPALEPAVAFWTKVFAVWQRGHLVLHDAEHLGVVYRVLEIPGPVAESLTEAQRKWVRNQADRTANELRQLALKQAAGRSLNAQEQALAKAINDGGGIIKGAADRLRTQRGTRERFLRGLEISGRYDGAFRAIFRDHGLPEDLAYLPHVESSFQVGARSSVGAAGMWQFMPATARSFMTVNAAVDERLNPLAAAQGAARYLAGAHRELRSWPLALTSYNHGIGGMRRAQARFGNDFARIVREYDAPSFGFASRNFYPEFLAARYIARSPAKYFPEGVRYQAALKAKPLVLKRPQHVHEVSKQSGTQLAALAELNPGWTNGTLKGKNRLPAGVTVWLPDGKQRSAPSNTAAPVLAGAGQEAFTGGRHKVVRGDSLWSIARRHGTSVAALRAHNGLDKKTPHLRIGQVLKLPVSGGRSDGIELAAGPTMHRVSRGDTPFGIATTYRINLRDLLAANNMSATTVIRPGQQLVIPSER